MATVEQLADEAIKRVHQPEVVAAVRAVLAAVVKAGPKGLPHDDAREIAGPDLLAVSLLLASGSIAILAVVVGPTHQIRFRSTDAALARLSLQQPEEMN